MVNGLNLDIQDTSTAVKPCPPAMVVVTVWLIPPTSKRPTRPQIAPDKHHSTDNYLFYLNTNILRSVFTFTNNSRSHIHACCTIDKYA